MVCRLAGVNEWQLVVVVDSQDLEVMRGDSGV